MPTYPDLRFWDLTRRQLSDAATQAEMRGQATEARRLGIFAQNLNSELDRQVPSYAAARAGHAAFAGAQDALEAGQNFATRRTMNNQEARAALLRMSPQERQLFQDGFVSAYIDKIRQVPDRQNVVGKIYNSPIAREQIQIALGPQRAAGLEAMLRVENVMNMARGAVQGNSTTARQLFELGLAGGAGSTLSSGNPFSDPMTALKTALVWGAARHGLRAGMAGVDERVARQVAQLLTSNDPRQLAMGMRVLGRNARLLDGLSQFDAAAARAGAVQLQPSQRAQ